MGTRSHVTSCHGNYEDFCWILYFGPLWTYVLRIPYQILLIASWSCDLQYFGNFGIFFIKILVSMETWTLLFTYFGLKDCRPFQTLHEEKQTDSWSCQMYFRIWVTMVTRSVVMETEVTPDWFLQISPDLQIFAHLKMFLIYYYVF